MSHKFMQNSKSKSQQDNYHRHRSLIYLSIFFNSAILLTIPMRGHLLLQDINRHPQPDKTDLE